MPLFDRWRTNLNKTSSNLNVPSSASKESKHSRNRKGSAVSSDESQDSPSHQSLPSISSSISLKPPAPKPSEESRIVRTGPDVNRRKNLSEIKQGSGDRKREDLQDPIHHPYQRQQLLSDDRPLPDLHKTRSNNNFFYHGPLSLDKIKNLFWVEEVAPEDHYTQTARVLNIVRERKRHCDVRLTVEKHHFYCHKAVLVTFSQDLQNRLESSSLWKSGKISIDLSTRAFDASTLESVINWMYTGDLHLRSWQNIDMLLAVTEGLKIPRLTKACRKMIPGVVCGPPNFGDLQPRQSTVLSTPVMRTEREPISHQKLEPKTQSAFSKYTATDDFPQWSFEQVISLLTKDSISIESEVDVYKAAVRWINHNRPNRMSHLERLMSTVRWVYMSAEEMIEAKHVDPALFNDPIVSNKAAMGQWQRDLLRRGIQVPLTGLPLNRVEQSHLRKIIMPGQSR